MNCSCEYCSPSKCDSYLNSCPPNPSYYTNCCPPNRSIQVPIDPIFPANDGFLRKPQKNTKIRKNIAHSKKFPRKKRSIKELPKSKSFESNHHRPRFESDKEEEDICEIKNFETQSSASICSRSSKMAERTLKNFLYDNESLKEAKYNKTSGCSELLNCLGPEVETWIFQCPKGFDPKTIVDLELGKLSKEKSVKVECFANRFDDQISLACLTPQKAKEYESVCDNVKILKPVGKIFITETKALVTSKRSKSSLQIKEENENIECSDDEDEIEECPSVTSKKIKRKINDQKFTIETTIKVENCAASEDRSKKNKKGKSSQDTFKKCMPICPPEPVPMKKKKK